VPKDHTFYERIMKIYPNLTQKNAKGEVRQFSQWFSLDWSASNNWDLLELLRVINLDNNRDMMY